jgi:hypothetical protein
MEPEPRSRRKKEGKRGGEKGMVEVNVGAFEASSSSSHSGGNASILGLLNE